MMSFREMFAEGIGYSFGFGDFDKVDFEDKSLEDMMNSLKKYKPKNMVYKDGMVSFYTDDNYEEKVSALGDKVRDFDYDVEEKGNKTYYVITTHLQTTQNRKNMSDFLKKSMK